LDPNPKLIESNPNSEFWIGSGPNPTKNMVGFALGLKKVNGTFWIGFDQVWTRGGDALRASPPPLTQNPKPKVVRSNIFYHIGALGMAGGRRHQRQVNP
jgi:hypothetical protein